MTTLSNRAYARARKEAEAMNAALQAQFQVRPGVGWAFPKSTIGPIDDQQIVITGIIAITHEMKIFVDMRLPAKGGTLNVKIKDPTDWALIAQFDLPEPAFKNSPRRGSFKLNGRNYTLVISNGTTRPQGDQPGRRCLRLRIPEIIPMPMV